MRLAARLGLLALAAMSAVAAVATVAAAAAAAEPAPVPQPAASVVDRGHALAEQRMLRFIERLDRYFGDENFENTTNESFIRLAPGLRIREGHRLAFKPRVRANLQLPSTEYRLGLIFSGRDEDGSPLGASDGADDGLSAGLRAALFDDPRTKLRLSAGSRFKPKPDPFVRLRLQHVRPFGRFALRPSVTGFWELKDGFGERSRLDVDYRLGPRSILRARGDATYGQSTQGVELRFGLSHFFTLRERSAWQIQARADSRAHRGGPLPGLRALPLVDVAALAVL